MALMIRSRGNLAICVGGMAIAAALAGSSLAGAQSTTPVAQWPALSLLPQSEHLEGGALATNDAGAAVAGWNSITGDGAAVAVAVRTADGAWATEHVGPLTPNAMVSFGQVGIDALGGKMVAWLEQVDRSAGRLIPVVLRRAAGAAAWSEPERLDAVPPGSAGLAAVMDPAGRITLAWREPITPRRAQIHFAHSPGPGVWNRGTLAAEAASQIRLSVARDGTVAASWHARDRRPWAAVMAGDGRWHRPRPLPLRMGLTQVVAAPRGWAVATGQGDRGRVLVTRAAAGEPTAAQRLASCGRPAHLTVPPPAVDGAGRVTVAWSCQDGAHTTIRTATAGARWRFSAPAAVAAGRGIGPVRAVAAGRTGRTVVAWREAQRGEGRRHLRVSERPGPAGRWATVGRVAAPGPAEGSPLDLAVDRRGRVTLAFVRSEIGLLAARGPA